MPNLIQSIIQKSITKTEKYVLKHLNMFPDKTSIEQRFKKTLTSEINAYIRAEQKLQENFKYSDFVESKVFENYMKNVYLKLKNISIQS